MAPLELARFVLFRGVMFAILEARTLAPDIRLLRVEAPRVARKRQAGQFVILRVHERGERIPITIADSDPVRGSITLVIQGIGKTTRLLNSLEAGDAILDVVGPLGRPSEVEALRHGVRDRRRRRRGDRLPHRRRAQAGRQPGRLDPRRADPLARGPGGRDPRDERRALRHHGRRQLRREGPRHRPAEGAAGRRASGSTTCSRSARSR